jgi:hypothetical protein
MSDTFYSLTERETMRRQFRISVVMIVAMSICAFILGFATPITHPKKATAVDDGRGFVGQLVSMDDD